MGIQNATSNTAVTLLVFATILVVSHPVKTAPPSHSKVQISKNSEKDSRTPAQRKIDSQLLIEIYRRQGKSADKNSPQGSQLKTDVKIDPKGRAFVDVRSEVTPELRNKIGLLGGTIVSDSVEHRSLLAWVPLLSLERLAEEPAVYAIQPAAEAITNQPVQK